MVTWLKKQEDDDALIWPSSGRASRPPLEVSARVALGGAPGKDAAATERFAG